MRSCAVLHCAYVAEAFIEDFPVCSLHNMHQTRYVLERLHVPGAAWMDDRPIVVPCGPLQEKHFEPKDSSGIRAHEDPKLASVPDAPSRKISPNYDLTAP